MSETKEQEYDYEDEIHSTKREMDSDDAYDMYRELASENLSEDIKAVILTYRNKHGYYHNNVDKILQHIEADLTYWKTYGGLK